jgi:hypothetical protein
VTFLSGATVTTGTTVLPINAPWAYRSESRDDFGFYSLDWDKPDVHTYYGDAVTVRVSDPAWRDKLKNGTDASNYYRRSDASWSTRHATVTVRFPDLSQTTTGFSSFNGGHPGFSPTDNTLRDIALSRVKRRINSLSQSYQALIPLAEIRELHGLIGGITHFTTDAVKALLEIKRTKGRSALRFAQKSWLLYSFGVKPMLADIHDAVQSMWNYLTKAERHDRVQGTMSKDWLSQTNGQVAGVVFVPLDYSAEAHHYLSYRFVAGWKFLVRSSNDYSVYKQLGLTVPAIIPALWELTPYSWVIDYFTTVGDLLEDIFVGQAGNSMYVVEDRLYRYKSVLTSEFHSADIPLHGYFQSHRRGQGTLEYYEFERTPLASLPPRSLRFRTADEIGRYGVTKLLNLVALLRSPLREVRKPGNIGRDWRRDPPRLDWD